MQRKKRSMRTCSRKKRLRSSGFEFGPDGCPVVRVEILPAYGTLCGSLDENALSRAYRSLPMCPLINHALGYADQVSEFLLAKGLMGEVVRKFHDSIIGLLLQFVNRNSRCIN